MHMLRGSFKLLIHIPDYMIKFFGQIIEGELCSCLKLKHKQIYLKFCYIKKGEIVSLEFSFDITNKLKLN